MLQEDNVSLEFNIPVCNKIQEFEQAVTTINREVYHTLRHLGYSISKDCGVSFDKNELTHPNALVFGCEPDFNAWLMKENEKPHAKDENLRTCGGHIHVGTDIPMVTGIQLMDLFLGVPSIILDNTPSSIKRRELYGKAGAMRPKPYGFEYRVLSNFWIFSPETIKWVYNQTRMICENSDAWKLTEKTAKKIQTCINTSDIELAKYLIGEYNCPMPDNNPKGW